MKKQAGITLVALIITIIVLLILVTVSISLVINNGILDKAKYAVDKYSEEEIKEQISLAYSEYQMETALGENVTLKEILENIDFTVKSLDKKEDNGEYEIVLDTKDGEQIYILKNGIVNRSNLPKGYRECKYIETTGTQYIKTGEIIDDMTEFYLKCSFESTNNQYNGIGHNDNTRFMFGICKTKFYAQICDEEIYSNAVDNNIHEFLLSNKNSEFYIDNVKIHSFEKKAINIDIYSGNGNGIGIGARASGNYYYCNEKIYAAKIWKNNQLAVDLIPCLDDKGVACMYDTVSGETFYNQGTGTFRYELKE